MAVAIRAADTATTASLTNASSKESDLHDSHAAATSRLDG